jgi:hypothetical protein
MWSSLPRLNLLLRRHLEIKGGGGWAAASIPLERTGVCVFWSQILSIGASAKCRPFSVHINWNSLDNGPTQSATQID